MSQEALSAPVALTRSRAGERTSVVLSRELTIGLAVFAFYLAVDLLPRAPRRARAEAVGQWLLDAERWLHIDIEGWLNRWLAGHARLAVLANYEYAVTYVVSAFGLLAWVLVRHPEAFRRVRTSFVVLNVTAISCFALLPVTPPRRLPGEHFVDTVAHGHTWGSWGSGMVDGANQMAAMPSLHFAWAAWVSAVLALFAAGRGVQLASAAHVAVTFLVIVATANHYVLDAIAAVGFVVVAERVAASREHTRARSTKVPAADAFFLHVEASGAPQTVGGVVVFDEGTAAIPTVADLRRVVADELDGLPRFRQRLAPASRWRRARWVDHPALDWDWHVAEAHVDGRAGLDRLVADLAETPLPRDRPLWRLLAVRGVEPHRSGVVLLVHHAVADGVGTVLQALSLLRPRTAIPRSPAGAEPGALVRAGAAVVGLGQLATDGRAHGRLGTGGPARDFATTGLDLATVRRTAGERGIRVTDLLLALVATALTSVRPDAGSAVRGSLRVAVPLMVHAPDDVAEGNATAAVMVDVPLDGRPPAAVAREVARRTTRLRRPTRAVAARFVMVTGLRVLPEPAAAWFARTVYGRRFFHGVLSNMPGPSGRLSMAGAPLAEVYPILPLAPGTAFSLGALSWDGVLGLGVATDPHAVDARSLARAIARAAAAADPARESATGSP